MHIRELIKKTKKYMVFILALIVLVPISTNFVLKLNSQNTAQLSFGSLFILFLYCGYDSYKKFKIKKFESGLITCISFILALLILSMLVLILTFIELNLQQPANQQVTEAANFYWLVVYNMVINMLVGGIAALTTGVVGAYAAEKL